MARIIPVHQPVLGGNEKKYVLDCLKSGWISSHGGYIDKFEKNFSKYCGVNYGVATTSGTSALHLCTATLNLKQGDEVIMPSFTMIAPALAVKYTGAKPMFVDAEQKTWTMDAAKIEERITKRTKAIIVVHIYGHPCDMDPIMEIAEKHNLHVIEDAAEAHGALYNGKKTGSFGDINAFSFYSNKIVTSGEGGMVVTNDKKLAERARWLKNFCMDKERRYYHAELGFKYPMTNMQAAIGFAQLENIEKFVKDKRSVAQKYNKLLKDIPGIVTPYEDKRVRNVYWMYGILIEDEFGKSRDEVKKLLFKKGIDTRFFFTGMHKQPIFEKDHRKYPVTDNLEKRGLYLPSSSNLSDEDIGYICDSIANAQKK